MPGGVVGWGEGCSCSSCSVSLKPLEMLPIVADAVSIQL